MNAASGGTANSEESDGAVAGQFHGNRNGDSSERIAESIREP